MPYTPKQKRAAGAQLGARREGKKKGGVMQHVPTKTLRHIAKSHTKKKSRKRGS